MSITVHPFDGPNLPARKGTLFLAPHIPTHRQMIRAKMVSDERYFRGAVSQSELERSRRLFHTSKAIGQDCEPVLKIWEQIRRKSK